MAGGVSAKSIQQWIPFPKGGLNRIDSPADLGQDDALTLDNFYVMPDGLYQPSQKSVAYTAAATQGMLYGYQSPNTLWHLINCHDGQIDLDGTKISGANVITNDLCQISHFNGSIFFCNATIHHYRYDIASATFNVDPFVADVTGSIMPSCACNYKNRFYFTSGVLAQAQTVWYGGLNGIAGTESTKALIPWNMGPMLRDSGAILFVTSWTYNEGLNNDEFLAVGTTSGDLLIFSGGWPASPDWKLCARTKIPTPLSFWSASPLGQDVLITTSRGLLSLSQVFKGQVSDAIYYSVSRKLGDGAKFTLSSSAVDQNKPLIYFAGGGGIINVLNYEMGAWSTFSMIPANETIYSLAWGAPNGPQSGGCLYVATNLGNVYQILGSGTVASKWQTPYFDFGQNLQKTNRMCRLLTTNVSGSTQNAQQYIYTEFGTTPGVTDTRTIPAGAGNTTETELATGGTGHHVSYNTIINSTNSYNKVRGFTAFVDIGGTY